MPLMKLGKVKFELNTAAYKAFAVKYKYDWSSQKRIGNTPSRQFTGRDETVDLDGVVYPGQFGSATTIKELREMADSGQPQQMVSGTGQVMGFYAITDIGRTDSELMANGQPRKIKFSLSLAYYGDKYK